jgi:hypothetical protein
MLADDFVTNHRDVALRYVTAPQIGGSWFILSEDSHAIHTTAQRYNFTHLGGEDFGLRHAGFPCIPCTTTLVKTSKPQGLHEKPDPSFSLGRIPDAPPVVLGRQTHLDNLLLSTNFDSGPRGCLAAQPALTSYVLPLEALPSANVANMDPSLSKWPAWRPGALTPATDLARQPSLADAETLRLNMTDKSETLGDEPQVAAHSTGFVFRKQGGNGGAKMSALGLVWEKEEEARLANIADAVSILFLMARLIEGLVEWSWSLPCPDSELDWFQPEGILLRCV